MYDYSYQEFLEDLDLFITRLGDYRPDVILAIARGGVTFGHFLSERLKIRDLFTLNSIHYDNTRKLDTIKLYNIPPLPEEANVLIVDDIVDSGETLQAIIRRLEAKFPKTHFKTGTIFTKQDAIIQPDFSCKEAKEWIRFFWNPPEK
ncbi:MAG: nicotinate phosphoribosyltransferase [Campylobacteraceae bacterium 4484_4]|nr:MAG: nicotinate phosphoribosyltransferase [Campylobacteraceae bacterium 4484_4]